MKVANDKNFDEVIDKDRLTLIDFYATWCMPCSMQAEVLEKMDNSRQKEFEIVKINVDESPNLSEKFKISSIPTLVFVKKGEIIGQIVGFSNEDKIIKKASELM